jgi:hypothetical protein
VEVHHARPLYPRGKSPRYPLDMRLDGTQRRSGRGGYEKESRHCPCQKLNPGRPARSVVTELHRLSVTYLLYEGLSKSFRTGRLERELQMIQLSATRCSCIAILWVSLVSFAAVTLRVVSLRVFIIVVVVVVYFVIDSVRKLLNTPSCNILTSHRPT